MKKIEYSSMYGKFNARKCLQIGDYLVVNNIMRIIDFVKIEDILKSSKHKSNVYKVKSVKFNEDYLVEEKDVLAFAEIIQGEDENE